MESLSKNNDCRLAEPLVSVLVCTYNRGDLLGQTLDSLLIQKFGWGKFEVVVVDNASTDNTKDIVADYQARNSNIRYVYEPILGVAFARNTGARKSEAKYIAYFDDDLIAEPDCLHNLIAPFLEEKKGVPSVVTGKVELFWHGNRPEWFPEKYETLLSRFDRGDEPRFMTSDEYLITMNVAFQRKTFLDIGGIREDLSRKGRMFICGGDNEIFRRYVNKKLRLYYQPKALVWHLVPHSRQQRNWLYKRVVGEGTTGVIMDYAKASPYTLFRRILYDGKVTSKLFWKALRNGPADTSDTKFDIFIELLRQLGRLSTEIQLLMGIKKVKTLSE